VSQAFDGELTRLRREFTAHATNCFEALERACEVLRTRDTRLARRVIEGDDQVDAAEVHIEAEVVRLITLHHPVAHDMRLLVAMLKVNYDLERIADHASNVAWLARRIIARGGQVPPHVLQLADHVVRNARAVFQAFLDQDQAAARAALLGDAAVDALDRTVRRDVHAMLAHDGEVDTALHLFRISRELERAGDHVANMAEDVIFLATGEIVRHGSPPAG